MLGVKLRSENIDQFDVLGERGQAIHLVASQILTVLKSKRPDLLAHFAVPQPSDNGRRIDWYAPGPGTVIAWNAATGGEQASALARLESVRAGIAQLRDAVQTKGGSNDAALLGQLLKWILHHPDPSYVFLVGGQPVITFWGFLHSGADRSLDPLHALRPVVSPGAIPQAPAIEGVARPLPPSLPPALATVPWWKRWWIWPLLLLALLALLFGLRACVPSLAPSLSLPGLGARDPAPREAPLSDPKLSLPTLAGAGAPGVNLPGSTVTGGGGASAGLPSAAGGESAVSGANPPGPAADAPGAAQPTPPTPPTPPATEGAAPQAAPPQADAAGSPPALPPADGPAEQGSTEPPALPESKDALQIPADAGDGNADFLNGNWRAGAGIQDRDTGQPLRLQYQFKNGEGHVTLNRHNGVQCTAPVSAAMNKGSLSISNSVAAKCSDGGTYDMPLIRCQPAATNIASCAGNYGDNQFPISMRRAQP